MNDENSNERLEVEEALEKVKEAEKRIPKTTKMSLFGHDGAGPGMARVQRMADRDYSHKLQKQKKAYQGQLKDIDEHTKMLRANDKRIIEQNLRITRTQSKRNPERALKGESNILKTELRVLMEKQRESKDKSVKTSIFGLPKRQVVRKTTRRGRGW